MSIGTGQRREILARHGAAGAALDELLAYNENRFDLSRFEGLAFPLADEPHLAAWRQYAADASTRGVLPALGERLPQLRFAIAKGVSLTPEYAAATRRGIFPAASPLLQLARSEEVRLRIHPTVAGSLPVLVAGEREDFETLVRAFSCRNEPDDVPASMGACIVTGLNNWDRVHAYRRDWEASHPGADESAWKEEFSRFTSRKENYQDRFLVLSSGFYSAVPPEAAGFMPGEWRRLSVEIRLEHECTHYFTYRVLGSMRNNLLDEIIADYAGLVKTLGSYDARLALLFFGLESYPEYRAGGRLENYAGNPPLSPEAFQVLRSLVYAAITNLAGADAAEPLARGDEAGLARRVVALAASPLELLASSEADVLRALELRDAPAEPLDLVIHDDDGLQDALEEFRRFAGRHALPPRAASDVSVVLDELLSNVIKYGFAGREGTIRLAVRLDGADLVATFDDDAPPFNVLEAERPKTDLSTAERPIGGLGILIVRQLCDGIDYAWSEGRNRVTVRKRVRG